MGFFKTEVFLWSIPVRRITVLGGLHILGSNCLWKLRSVQGYEVLGTTFQEACPGASEYIVEHRGGHWQCVSTFFGGCSVRVKGFNAVTAPADGYLVVVRWTPHPVIVTIGDNKDHIRVLLYS